ncbi:MAG: hypothetical protein VBE63_30605, partial [Lamprobacter sp.]|uniref:hypothetical protein n=1 Tax=Lamprobacter sp. TaxID=3100796 RepID=UPI002B26334B
MPSVQFDTLLGEDHQLQLIVPEEIPAGAVNVVVTAKLAPQNDAKQTLSELFAELDRMPCQPLSRQEVDRTIAEERA